MKTVFFVLLIALCNGLFGQTFSLRSKDLGGQITPKEMLNGFGCTGGNKSPQLFWENPPKGTKSFAVTMYDENAPTGSGWWHWVVFNIDSTVRDLKSGAGTIDASIAPSNCVQSKTDFGTYGYGGPCPTPGSGFHKYTITVYALSVEKLGLDMNANPALVGFMLGQATIEKASIVVYCKQ